MARTYGVMESTVAEVLPELYRAILDAVARLEAAGERPRAARLRRDATAAYSRAWDDRARRRLEALLRTADRPVPTAKPRRGLGRHPAPRSLAPTVTSVAHPER